MNEDKHQFQRVFTALIVSAYTFIATTIGIFPVIKVVSSFPNDVVTGILLAGIALIVLLLSNACIGYVVWKHIYEQK